MSLMFLCEYVPEAKVDEDRQASLLEIANCEEPFDWDDGYDTLEDCRAAVAGAIAYLATVPNIETQRIDIPGAQYAVLAAGGMTPSDIPSDACEQFRILALYAPAVFTQLERWAIEDRRAERQRRAARRRAKKRLSERGPTLTETGVFTIRCEGTLQYEILDPDGRMIAWMADRRRAALIVDLLNGVWPKELDRHSSSCEANGTNPGNERHTP